MSRTRIKQLRGRLPAGHQSGGLYETRKTAAGWAPRTKLGAEVNQNGTEIGALFSPSGRSLLFAGDTKDPDSGEFFVWYEHGRETWPPDCPSHGG